MSALFTALVEGETKASLASKVITLRTAAADCRRLIEESFEGDDTKVVSPILTLAKIDTALQTALFLSLGE